METTNKDPRPADTSTKELLSVPGGGEGAAEGVGGNEGGALGVNSPVALSKGEGVMVEDCSHCALVGSNHGDGVAVDGSHGDGVAVDGSHGDGVAVDGSHGVAVGNSHGDVVDPDGEGVRGDDVSATVVVGDASSCTGSIGDSGS